MDQMANEPMLSQGVIILSREFAKLYLGLFAAIVSKTKFDWKNRFFRPELKNFVY